MQTEVKFAHLMHIFAWLCCVFAVYRMNPPRRNVSVLLPVLLVVAALAAIIVSFVMRKKFFRLSTEALAWQRLVDFPA